MRSQVCGARDARLHGQVRGHVGVIRDIDQSRQWHQADQLRLARLYALLVGQLADRLPHQPHGRDREIEQVHRYLDATQLGQLQAQRLDARQAADRSRTRRAIRLASSRSRRLEVDVVRDQEWPRPDGDRARGGMEPRRAEVGRVARGR